MEEKTGFDPKMLMALALCLAMWFAWQKHLEKKYPQMLASKTEAQVSQSNVLVDSTEKENKNIQTVGVPAQDKARVASKNIPSNFPRRDWVFNNGKWNVVFDSLGGVIKGVQVTGFAEHKNSESHFILNNEAEATLSILTEGNKTRDFSDVNFITKQISEKEIQFVGEKEGLVVKKTFKIHPELYKINAHLELSGDLSGVEKIVIEGKKKIPLKAKSGGFLSFAPPENESYQEYFIKYKNKSDRNIISHEETPEKTYEQVHTAAIGDRYFTTLFFNKGTVLPTVQTGRSQEASFIKMNYPVLEKKNSLNIELDLFSGPKNMTLLKKIDENLADVVDYGMFSIIALPLLALMKWFNGIIGNYGIAIILLTLIVRLVTFPFTYMSFKSMKAMQKIQPLVASLKEKYKGNTQQFNIEVMKLYKENKVNPMGGCLPMLLQIPVFWALYQVLQNSIELYRSPFYGWITDLSQKDPYYVLPILMGSAMFIQQKLTPTTMDPAQAKIMLFMPVFFSFLMFSLPSGLTLYIFVSTLFGIAQQVIVLKDKPVTKIKSQPAI